MTVSSVNHINYFQVMLLFYLAGVLNNICIVLLPTSYPKHAKSLSNTDSSLHR